MILTSILVLWCVCLLSCGGRPPRTVGELLTFYGFENEGLTRIAVPIRIEGAIDDKGIYKGTRVDGFLFMQEDNTRLCFAHLEDEIQLNFCEIANENLLINELPISGYEYADFSKQEIALVGAIRSPRGEEFTGIRNLNLGSNNPTQVSSTRVEYRNMEEQEINYCRQEKMNTILSPEMMGMSISNVLERLNLPIGKLKDVLWEFEAIQTVGYSYRNEDGVQMVFYGEIDGSSNESDTVPPEQMKCVGIEYYSPATETYECLGRIIEIANLKDKTYGFIILDHLENEQFPAAK